MPGPPLHVHSSEDELFYVLEGELAFQVDAQRILAKGGTTIFALRETTQDCS
jgi:uncharacterized cupin superfamily protein